MSSSRIIRKGAAVLLGALLATSITACGSSDNKSSGAPKPVASIENLTGNSTEVILDKGFVAALGQLKLLPAATGTAQLTKTSLVFPITGGNVTVFKPGTVSPYVIGQLQHEGSGFTLTAGDTVVQISNLNVDPGVSRVYGDVSVNSQPVVSSAFIFQLDGRTLQPLKSGSGTATLQGTKVEISDVAAGLLDKTFKTDAVKAGLLVGIAKITVKTS